MSPGSRSRRTSCSPGATSSARPGSPNRRRTCRNPLARIPTRAKIPEGGRMRGRCRLMSHSKPLLASATAALLIASSAGAASGPVVTVTQVLGGLNHVAAGGYEPPDVSVAAGPGFVVELVNLAARVWATGGGAPGLTDPRVTYDAASGRFFASVSDVTRAGVLLAVSTSGDPTGSWTVSSFSASGCADQTRLGLADATVVLAADVYDGCEQAGTHLLGAELWTVSKADLVAGSTAPAFATFGPTSTYASLAPAQSLSPTSPDYVVSVDQRASRVVHLLTVDGVPPDAVTVKEVAAPPITPLLRPPPASQPPTTGFRPAIPTNDSRILDSVWENGRLWFSANARCTPAGDSLIRTCARVAELDTSTQTVVWQTDLGLAGAHVFYPAVRPDAAGNLVIVAGESGPQGLPRPVVFRRTLHGTPAAPGVLPERAGTYRGDRYGDYFGAARDPVDGGVIWVGGEAGTDAPPGVGWSTTVAAAVVTQAGGTPPVSADLGPPDVRALATAARAGGSVTLAYRALGDGDAIRAVVSVRNATKALVYRTTTRAATLRADRRYTVVWPAKKARGAFTFCVHAVSVSGLRSRESCAAITV